MEQGRGPHAPPAPPPFDMRLRVNRFVKLLVDRLNKPSRAEAPSVCLLGKYVFLLFEMVLVPADQWCGGCHYRSPAKVLLQLRPKVAAHGGRRKGCRGPFPRWG